MDSAHGGGEVPRVARYLARRYGGYGARGLDQVIEARHGPVARLFRERGEAEFRRLEAAVVAELLDVRYAEGVISPGRRRTMSPLVQPLLEGRTVAYLDVDLATVRPRIRGGASHARCCSRTPRPAGARSSPSAVRRSSGSPRSPWSARAPRSASQDRPRPAHRPGRRRALQSQERTSA
ncbi:shikimate kinase [Kocuria rhizophila]|nr:shikimate kinase [Kocuria rhizophila]